MTELGSVSLQVNADVEKAIGQIQRLQEAVGKFRNKVVDELSDTFTLDPALKDFKLLSTSLAGIDSQISSLTSSSKGIDLAEPFRTALEELQKLRVGIASGLGDPKGNRAQEEKLQAGLFELETRGAAEVAQAKTEAWEQALAAAEQAISEERTLQEGLFTLQTQGAHDVALAKEQAFELSKKVAKEEGAIQESLFLQSTQLAHEAALEKEKAYERSAQAAIRAADIEAKAQEDLGARLSRAIESTPGGKAARALQDAAFARSAAEASGLSVAVAKSSNPLTRFTGLIHQADESLKKFGLTSRDISVILGAGLAGGVAFAIRSIVEFATASLQLAAELEKIQNLTEGFFGEFSQQAEQFAKDAVNAFGISRREALLFQNDFGKALSGVGIAQQDAQKLSETLTTLSVALARSTPGTTVEQAHTALTGIFRGEFDALEKFTGGLKLTDIQNEAVRLGFAKTKEDASKLDIALAGVNLTVGASKVQLEELAASTGELGSETERFQAQLEEVQIALGTILLPTLIEFLQNVNLLLTPITKLSQFVDFLGQQAEKSGDKMDDFSAKLGRVGRGFILGGLIGGLRAIFDSGNAAADAVADIASQADILNASLNATTGTIEVTADKLEELAKARESLNRAIADAERDENAAEINLQRTREDSVRKIADANRDIKRAYRDRNRAIADANEKMSDVELENFRAIRDAEEKLSDARRDNAKKVNDAEDALAKARRARNDDILKGLISVEEALLSGDALAFNRAQRELSEARRKDAIKDAQKNVTESTAEAERNLGRLERDVAEERIDALERVDDAKRDQARAFKDANEKIADAERRRGEVEIEVNRALFDAQTRLEEAIRRGEEAVADARDRFNELKAEIGDTAERTKTLADQLNRLRDILLDPVFTDDPRFAPEGSGRSALDSWLDAGRASGGPVWPGGMFPVGERGPELFIPNRGGEIISNDVLRKLIAAMNRGQGSGGGRGDTWNIFESVDADTTARAVALRLAQGIRQ